MTSVPTLRSARRSGTGFSSATTGKLSRHCSSSLRRVDLAYLREFQDHIGPNHPKQDTWLDVVLADDPPRRPFYGGARGGCKSNSLRRFFVSRRLLHPGSVGLLLRRTYPELYENHILKLMKELPGTLYHYNGTTHEFRFPNGSRQILGYCRNDADLKRYFGQEYDDISIDEITEWQEFWYDSLCGSCRTIRSDLTPMVVVTGMPGGIGHAWVRRRWVDRDFYANEKPEDYHFTQATVDDNPTLMDTDPGYLAMLDGIRDENLRRAWRYGDWDVFSGQYFHELRRDLHGFTGDPPKGWNFRMMDYGEHSPSAVYWCRVDRDGHLWFYRELYEVGLRYSALAARIKQLTPAGEKIRYTVAPPDVFQVAKGTGEVGSETLTKHGVPVIRADDRRIEGWRQMREWLTPVALHVNTETCRAWWRTVPSLIYDEHNVEDVDTDGEDHAGDSTRYGIMSRPPRFRPEREKVPETSAEAILRDAQS